MTRKHRRLLIATLIAVPLLALFIVWAFVDSPPPDDADLRLAYEDIPDEENAFTYFERAAATLGWRPRGPEVEEIKALLEPQGWDEARVAEILSDKEDLLRDLERGAACVKCAIYTEQPTVSDITAGTFSPLLSLAWLAALQAEHLFRAGAEKDALAKAIQIVRFGALTQNGMGDVGHYIFGTAIKEIGLERLRRVVSNGRFSSEQLLASIEFLGEDRATEEGLANLCKLEYQTYAEMLGGYSGAEFCRELEIHGFRQYLFRYKPNLTKNYMASAYRIQVDNATRPWADMVAVKEPDYSANTWEEIKLYASGNAAGIVLYCFLAPTDTDNKMKCRCRTTENATRILLTLKCYQLDHGELPDTLDALVPDYLNEVPRDDFDGKPMKYSKAKRIVYAVGPDLTDNGGIAEDDREGVLPDPGYDLIYKITF